MTLNELMDAVYVETARPDLVNETRNKLVGAIVQYHNIDYFWRDIATAQVVFDISNYIQVLDIQSLPRFRSLSYARKYDPTIVANENTPSLLPPLYPQWWTLKRAMDLLTIIAPDDLFDEFHCEKLDVMYGVGGSMMIKSSTSLKYLQVGWYQQPLVGVGTLDAEGTPIIDGSVAFPTYGNGSFIASDFPCLLIYAAASGVLQSIGQNDASRKYDNPSPNAGGLVQGQLEQMIKSNIQVKGY